jgi:hypothetical protein
MRKEIFLGITTTFVLLAGLSTHIAMAQNMTETAGNAMSNLSSKASEMGQNASNAMGNATENVNKTGQSFMEKAGQALSNLTEAITGKK